MAADRSASPAKVLEQLHHAMNDHDLERFLACFAEDYRGEQPAHLDRAFGGREQVGENWGAIFRDVGDFEADLIRSALDGETVWAEWNWQGALGERSVCEKANRRAGLLRQRQHAAVRRRCRRRTHQPDLRLQVSRAMDW